MYTIIMYHNYGPKDVEEGGCFCEEPTRFFDSAQACDICVTCGVVLEPVLMEVTEYGYDEFGHDINYISEFAGHKIDFGHNSRMDHFQVTAMSAADVRMHDINKSIEAICDAFRIQYRSILYYTAIDFSQKLEEKVRICGRKRKASYAAAFYFACKIHNAFRELRTIADVCGFDLKDLNYGVRMFNEHLKDVVSVREELPHENLIYSSILELNIDDAKKRSLRVSILDVMKEHSDLFYGGRKPRTIAAALILLLGVKHGLTAVNVSKNLKISHAALISCARELSTTYNIAF